MDLKREKEAEDSRTVHGASSAVRRTDADYPSPPRVEHRRYVKDYLGVQREGEPRYLRMSDLAKKTGSSSSYIKKLIDHNRIPEAFRAYRDDRDENGRTLIPDRRCIIPTSRTNHGEGDDMKVVDYLFSLDEVPQEWVDNPKVRPEPGVVLVGDESMPLGERIEATFGLPVGERSEEEMRSRPVAYQHYPSTQDSRSQEHLKERVEELEAELEGLNSDDRWEDVLEIDEDVLPRALRSIMEVDSNFREKYFAEERRAAIERVEGEISELNAKLDSTSQAIDSLTKRDRATLRRYGIDLNELEKHPEIAGVAVYFRNTDDLSVRDIEGVDVISVEP